MINHNTPINTPVRWGGGAAPVGCGYTTSVVWRDGTVDIRMPSGDVSLDVPIEDLEVDPVGVEV